MSCILFFNGGSAILLRRVYKSSKPYVRSEIFIAIDFFHNFDHPSI